MRPPLGHLHDPGREAIARGILYGVLLYTSWNFKVMSSLPRVLDTRQWWAPLLFPETVALAVALVLSSKARASLPELPRPRLFYGSLTLSWVALLVSSVFSEPHVAYLTRVVILQYALPLALFVLLLRHVESASHLRWCTIALVTGGLLLFIVATPIYFLSFHAFAPERPLPWPASRIIYNRMLIPLVHNEPAMLYDNVTFGNVLNVSQLLVVLLPLALGWLFVTRHKREQIIAGLAAAMFLFHIFLCYSRGAILPVIGTLAVVIWLFWTGRHRLRWPVVGLSVAFLVMTLASPHVPRYWWSQITFAKGSTAWERVGFVVSPLRLQEYLTKEDRKQYRLHDVVARAGTRDWYLRMLTTGLGYGTYGTLIGMGPGAGTHNMFLNALVNTGAPGLLGLLGLVGWAVANFVGGRRPWRAPPEQRAGDLYPFLLLAFVNIIAIGVLSLYEFEYLGTSTGAMVFWFLLGASAKRATGLI